MVEGRGSWAGGYNDRVYRKIGGEGGCLVERGGYVGGGGGEGVSMGRRVGISFVGIMVCHGRRMVHQGECWGGGSGVMGAGRGVGQKGESGLGWCVG